jgi:hypothetical protein
MAATSIQIAIIMKDTAMAINTNIIMDISTSTIMITNNTSMIMDIMSTSTTISRTKTKRDTRVLV